MVPIFSRAFIASSRGFVSFRGGLGVLLLMLALAIPSTIIFKAAVIVPTPPIIASPGPTNDCFSHVSDVVGVRLYSQNDEDGALLQILWCMGGHGKQEYFEFGSETGVQVNTRILRELYGWHGHLLDGGNEDPAILLHKEWFTPSNIVSPLQKYRASKDLDVLSIDADYDDFCIMREILLAGYKPRVLIVEFNANFGHEWSVSTVAKPVGEETGIRWGKFYMSSVLVNSQFWFRQYFMIILKYILLISK